MDSKKILIVDDIETNRALLRIIFQDDYEIVEAENGLVAYNILKENNNIVVVILDINMPVMNGFELLAKVKNDEQIKMIPIIVVTGTNDQENEIKALDYGAVNLISKPYDPRIVKQRVTNAINRQEINLIKQENSLLRSYQATQLQLQTILDNLAGGICLIEIDKKFKPIYINKGFTALTGYDMEGFKIINNDMKKRVHRDDLDNYTKTVLKAVNENGAKEVIFRAYSRNGEIRWQHGYFVSIKYDSPYPVVIAIIFDITELHNAEQELKNTSEQLKTLMDNIPGGVVIFELDKHLSISYCNEGLYNLFDYTDDDKKHFNNTCEQLIHPQAYEKLHKALETAVTKNCTLEETFFGVKSNGKVGYFLIRGCCISKSKNDVPRFYAVVIDTTKEQEQAEELRFLAEYDQLTYIYNKRTFCQTTEKMLKLYPETKYALVSFDIEQN